MAALKTFRPDLIILNWPLESITGVIRIGEIRAFLTNTK